MLTFQDFLRARDRPAFLMRLVSEHRASPLVRQAEIADLYDRRQNKTILEYVRRLYTLSGLPREDFTASNNRLCSNFFARLNTQRAAYLLGNGVTFCGTGVKERLGADFDARLMEAGRLSLVHGLTFLFYNADRVHVFPVTQFAPLWDEETGELRAGVRFWRIDPAKPLHAVLYEEEGYTRYAADGRTLRETEGRRAYRLIVRRAPADAEPEILGENYGALPVAPLWGSRRHQSTLAGMRGQIDSFDLICSGFANDLTDCAEIYWLLENCGMTDAELARFRDRLKLQHIAAADTGGEGRITPYTQEPPYAARAAYLELMRRRIYEDFGGLDTSALASGRRTATEIRAAYQALDEEADDFEYQVIGAVQRILRLIGIEDTPLFRRSRITNQLEETRTVMMEAGVLDRRTLLSKLPNLTPEEAAQALAAEEQEKTR